MIIYPAIDLKDGQVVRLALGDLQHMTVYSADPVAVAEQWLAAGAQWLHVVNLDGAFSLHNANQHIIARLSQLPLAVQCGGGLRTLADVRAMFKVGVKRVVLGTLAAEQPASIRAIIDEWGADAVAVALDAKDGKVTTRGWQTATDLTPTVLGQQLYALGARHALYTDVSRDGQLTGVNVAATVELARATRLNVIASGGVSSLEDLRQLKASGLVAGAVLGKALYEHIIDLSAALAVAADQMGAESC